MIHQAGKLNVHSTSTGLLGNDRDPRSVLPKMSGSKLCDAAKKVMMMSQRKFRGYPSNQRSVVEAVSLARLTALKFDLKCQCLLTGNLGDAYTLFNRKKGVASKQGSSLLALRFSQLLALGESVPSGARHDSYLDCR
jgi:hypothetical protein